MRSPGKYHKQWHRQFAWFPREINGVTVWWEHYEMRYVEQKEVSDCPCPFHTSGWWEFRLLDADGNPEKETVYTGIDPS